MGKRHEVRVKAVGTPTRGMFRGELRPNEWLSSVSPRLSGGLSSRNADPESDGLHVRGAVKARRRLVNAPTRKLVAVNVMPSARIKVYDVMDVDTGQTGVISSNCSAIEPSHLKNAASVSGRWRRLDGLKEGDFIPLGKGRGRSQLGFESEPARIDDGAGSD